MNLITTTSIRTILEQWSFCIEFINSRIFFKQSSLLDIKDFKLVEKLRSIGAKKLKKKFVKISFDTRLKSRIQENKKE